MLTACRRMAAAGFLITTACAVLAAIITVHVSAIDAPFWDEWYYTDPHETLRHLFRLHNEHLIVTTKVVLLFDYYWFDAQGILSRFFIWSELAAASIAVIVLARLSGVRERLSLYFLACVTICSLFSGFAWENLRWPFQVGSIAGLAGPTVAIAAVAAFSTNRRTILLVLAHAALLAGMFGFASALMAPIIVAAMAVFLRLRWRVCIGFLITFAIGWTVYLSVREGGSLHLAAALAHPDAILTFAVRDLGGPYGVAINYWHYFGVVVPGDLTSAWYIGAAMILANIFLTLWLIGRRQLDPGVVGLVTLSGMCLVTAFLTAVGRADMDPGQALSSRYALCGGLYLAATIALWLAAAQRCNWNGFSICLLSGFATAAIILFVAADIPLIKNLTDRYREELTGLTALVVGLRDEAGIKKIAYDVNLAVGRSAALKTAGKFHFADEWARKIGTDFPLSSKSDSCPGEISNTVLVGDGMRVQGFASRALVWGGARDIVMVNAAGMIVGYGRIPPRPSEFYSFLRFFDGRVDWQGHVKQTSLEGIKGFLAAPDGNTCRLW